MNPILKNFTAAELLQAYAEKCVDCAADMIADMATDPEWLRSELELKRTGPFSVENVISAAREQAFTIFPELAYDDNEYDNTHQPNVAVSPLENFIDDAIRVQARTKRIELSLK